MPNGRTIAGLPVGYWMVGLLAGVIGFVWMRQKTKAPTSPGTGAQTPSFTQAQQTADFQIFSALTGQQQASDLNFLSEAAGLFAGGSSPTTNTPSSSPPSTGTVPPAVQGYYQQGLAGALAGSGTSPQAAALGRAVQSTPASQRGSLEQFFLLNQANKEAGYDYFGSSGLVQQPLGVAPGE